MKDIENIDELLNERKNKKISVKIEESKVKDLTEKLNLDAIQVTDYSMDQIKEIDFTKDFEEFDYFKISKEKEIIIDDLDKNVEKMDNIEKKILNDNSENETIIYFNDIEMKYDNESKIMDGLNLRIKSGEFIYLVGPSGSGKSTLIKMIYRDIINTGGEVIVDDINVTKLKQNQLHLLRRKIGVIFQDYKLLPDRTVFDNVKYSLEVTNYPKNKRKEQVLKTLKIVGILEQKDKYPAELSGGQQQRVAIARAIVDEPKIIVADEPTGNLDPQNALIIMDIIERINKKGTTVIMATHDVGIVNRYKHRVVLIKRGKVDADNLDGGYIYE